MLKLEAIKAGQEIEGLIPGELVRVVAVEWYGTDQIAVTYRHISGGVDEAILTRENEGSLSSAAKGLAWSFESDAEQFKLVLEAFRIKLGALFDPMTAIYSSQIDPLPHQISAVYDVMLKKNPLRFVLADDPGAGKTIMAGLLIKELIYRADAQRVLIIVPGSLADQWHDEMQVKFGLQFEIFSPDRISETASGNFFQDRDLIIARLDQVARNDKMIEKLELAEWDLVIVDEAHRMAAHSYSPEKMKRTRRYQLGELLAKSARHFLMMTATPHNGKNSDFHLWLRLLDQDQFYYANDEEEVKTADVSEVMRRLVKEQLLKFDGTRLFPKREAETVLYDLSASEQKLYEDVTEYVRNGMNQAEQIKNKKRKGQIGFALTILQRRLASSPYSICSSLKRRLERLEKELEERRKHPERYLSEIPVSDEFSSSEFDWEEYDGYDEELPVSDTDEICETAFAAETLEALEEELAVLRDLTEQAEAIVSSNLDRKWSSLSKLLQSEQMKSAGGTREKLIIFTEYRDTLDYLEQKIRDLLGSEPGSVCTIHGATRSDERNKIQEEFRNNPEVAVLVATDAAGEGVNLQRAHLMINYDLPWNPNRLEQRFGRIHRIGQTETCKMWNLVAKGTREGVVFDRLFAKMQTASETLGGRVFDILGSAFDNISLNDLLIKMILEGTTEEARNFMTEKIEGIFEREHLESVIQRNSLVEQAFTPETLYKVKQEMEEAEARKLLPCFVFRFFDKALQHFEGSMKRREGHRYEIKNVPYSIQNNRRELDLCRASIPKSYQRICFEKEEIRVNGKPSAEFIHPNHPLLRSMMSLILEGKDAVLKPGTVMYDKNDEGDQPSLIFLIDHRVPEADGGKTVSRSLQFVRVGSDWQSQNAGWAPHLDLDPIPKELQPLAERVKREEWLSNGDLEKKAVQHALAGTAQEHFKKTEEERKRYVEKTRRAVKERLEPAIQKLASQVVRMEIEVKNGSQPEMNLQRLKQRYNELKQRFAQRNEELDRAENVVFRPPVILGGILVIPKGLADRESEQAESFTPDVAVRKRIEEIAMRRVIETEKSFGCQVTDVSARKCGWDITSIPPQRDPNGPVPESRHIEVKGRRKGAPTVTVSHNEVASAVNQRDKYILAIVLVDGDKTEGPFYIRNPFTREMAYGEVSVNLDMDILLDRAVAPEETFAASDQRER